MSIVKTLDGPRVRVVSPVVKEKVYGGKDLLKSQFLVNVNLVSNALSTLVAREKPGFQALSKGLIVLLCAEVVQQGVTDHGALHSECSAANSG